MDELIRKLTEAYGPSGFEDQMRDLIRPEVEIHPAAARLYPHECLAAERFLLRIAAIFQASSAPR